ncbi:MAG: DUF4412 domain-containing protein [Bacteroidetes bacterium]|nr:DUF4412 domain-containing protein [Bacteroidota bacterium]
MQYLKLPASIFLLATISFVISCNQASKKMSESPIAQTSNADTTKGNAANEMKNSEKQATNGSEQTNDSSSQQNANADSMLAKGMSAMFGKNDSGILKNLGGGKNMDDMMKKMQSMMGGKNGNPGDALSKLILNSQMGQLKDDNPLKEVAKGMQQAQENGTAGPDKTYTTVYTPEQPENYKVPVSGNGSVIMLQYSGGTSTKGIKDGLWKNVLINTNPVQWNVFTEGYMESSQINMKVHATSLASVHENYSINLNEQYKKYSKQYRTEVGKNEYDVQVQKIGAEKMFGYNCIHIKIIYTLKALGQTSHEENEEWYSSEVPGASFVSPVIFENHSPAVVKKIIDAGCTGILVKSITRSTGTSNVLQLSSITKKDMPDSMFKLPANYQEDKNVALYDIQ